MVLPSMDNIFMENLLFPWCANMMCWNISQRPALAMPHHHWHVHHGCWQPSKLSADGSP
uniref:Uncharacterized protein n=1 Tax=Aegilops tauschii subsp. strangulata TaxID=200361 RepID=A0A453RIS9_AEGTS